MALKIGMVNTKGGVGKTTSAIFLGCALAEYGTVEVWDADPQGSATEWADLAAESGDPLPFETRVMNRSSLTRQAERTEVDYVLIDTPPGDGGVIDTVANVADALILLSQPAVMDLRRLFTTAQSMPPGKPLIALLTMADRRQIRYREARELLNDTDILAAFTQDISDTVKICEAAESRPKKLYEYESVARELLEVMK